ncbi:MAG TPA: hypothetical protein VN033_07900 [Vulgatibacter sp.]|nr:hypothetical protein [Vulgatibacter sp.]
MDEVRDHLEHQAEWLLRRAASLARRLRPGANRATVADLADDLFGDAIRRFLESADGGWFDERPRVSLEAQVRTLLGYSLQQAMTDVLRKGRRLVLVDAVPDDGAAASPGAEAAIDQARREAELRRAIHALGPARRLWYVAIHRPEELTLDHVREAAAFRQGGGAAVRRPVDEAWALFAAAREDRSLVADEPGWKRTVATIFRMDVPLDQASARELKRAVGSIDTQLCRAAKEILERFGRGIPDAPPAADGEARRLP